jgi:hypothetical protein
MREVQSRFHRGKISRTRRKLQTFSELRALLPATASISLEVTSSTVF